MHFTREDSVVQKTTVALSTLLKENDKTIWDLKIKEKTFTGLIHSGADVPTITIEEQPSQWPVMEVNSTLIGLGTISFKEIKQSATKL